MFRGPRGGSIHANDADGVTDQKEQIMTNTGNRRVVANITLSLDGGAPAGGGGEEH